ITTGWRTLRQPVHFSCAGRVSGSKWPESGRFERFLQEFEYLLQLLPRGLHQDVPVDPDDPLRAKRDLDFPAGCDMRIPQVVRLVFRVLKVFGSVETAVVARERRNDAAWLTQEMNELAMGEKLVQSESVP